VARNPGCAKMTTVLQRADLSFAETLAPAGVVGAVQSDDGGAFAAILAVSLPSAEAVASEPMVGHAVATPAAPAPEVRDAAAEPGSDVCSADVEGVFAVPYPTEATALGTLGAVLTPPAIVEDEEQVAQPAPAAQDGMMRAAATLIAGRVGEPVARQKGRADRPSTPPPPEESSETVLQASPAPALETAIDQVAPALPVAAPRALVDDLPAGEDPDDAPVVRAGVAQSAPDEPLPDAAVAPSRHSVGQDGKGEGAAHAAPHPPLEAMAAKVPERISHPTAGVPAGEGAEAVNLPSSPLSPPTDSVAQAAAPAATVAPPPRLRAAGDARRLHERSPVPAVAAESAAMTAAAEGTPGVLRAEAGMTEVEPMAPTTRQAQDLSPVEPRIDHQASAEATPAKTAEMPDDMPVVRAGLSDDGRILPPARPAPEADQAVVSPARGNDLRAPDFTGAPPTTTLTANTPATPTPNPTPNPLAMPARPVLDTRRADWVDRVGAEIEAAHRDGKLDIELSLRPKNLGELRIRIEISGSDTTIQIATETQSAARLISSHEERLAQILDSSGLRLSAIAASVGGGAHPGGGRGHEKGQRNQTAAAAAVGKANRAAAGSTGIPSNQRELAERVSMINLIA
jgi:hypothetical protein